MIIDNKIVKYRFGLVVRLKAIKYKKDIFFCLFSYTSPIFITLNLSFSLD